MCRVCCCGAFRLSSKRARFDGDDDDDDSSDSSDGGDTRGSLPRRHNLRTKEERSGGRGFGRRAPVMDSSDDNIAVSEEEEDDDDSDADEKRDDIVGMYSIRVPRVGSLSVARPMAMLLEQEVLVRGRWMPC